MENVCDICKSQFKDESSLALHRIQCSNIYKCEHCQLKFNSKDKYERHKNTLKCHKKRKYICPQCGYVAKTLKDMEKHGCAAFKCSKCDKMFQYRNARRRHELVCQKKMFVCENCGKGFDTYGEKSKHKLTCHKDSDDPPQPPANRLKWRCPYCDMRFKTRHEHYLHWRNNHMQIGTGDLQSRPWTDDSEAPWVDQSGNVDTELQQTYNADQHLILAPSQVDSNPRVYNLPVTSDLTVDEIIDFVREINRTFGNSFRINVDLGYILRNRDTGVYRYFRPNPSGGFFTHPSRINSEQDIDALKRVLKKQGIHTVHVE